MLGYTFLVTALYDASFRLTALPESDKSSSDRVISMIATYRAHTPGNTVGFEKQTEAVANLLSQYIQEEEEVAQSI